jgi:predicted MFS family arabinose efflux permease
MTRPASTFPLSGLLALATAGFITILTEALPAGLLPQMGASLDASGAMVGQLVTSYALGSLLCAIPLTAATQGVRRKRLLLATIAGFALVNGVTALSTSYLLTIAARFVAGVFAGMLWALLAGYAVRMVAPQHKGRAMAVAMAGIPVGLSLGVPAGTLLGATLGWQYAFGIMSAMALALIAWVTVAVPDFPGQSGARRAPVGQVLSISGVKAVLATTFVYVLAHNILYTYISPFLAPAGLERKADAVLFIFGAASIVGLWLAGLLIDRRLRAVVLARTAAFGLAAMALGLWGTHPAAVYIAVGVWGVAFGGAPTFFQTALANVAANVAANVGNSAGDVAQSLLVTSWNLAIAGGGLFGGLMLSAAGAGSLPWTLCLLLAGALAIAAHSRQHAFPAR